MAHIADLMVDHVATKMADKKAAREYSPSAQSVLKENVIKQSTEREKYVWRLHQPADTKKYGLFPPKFLSPATKTADDASPISSNNSEKRAPPKAKVKEPSLVRRRKISVPELGPMTTVQEAAMDSPTIPGRPAAHERSTSAPGHHPGRNNQTEAPLFFIPEPTTDEVVDDRFIFPRDPPPIGVQKPAARPSVTSKTLSPLIIPHSMSSLSQRLGRQGSVKKIRSSSNPPEVPPKSAQWLDSSPFPRASPFTPMSAMQSTAPTTVANTPVSAIEGRSSPKPWTTLSGRSSPISKPWVSAMSGRVSPKVNALSNGRASPMAFANPVTVPTYHTAQSHRRHDSDTTSKVTHQSAHRRHESEASIMCRGRPKKRKDMLPTSSPIKQPTSMPVQTQEARDEAARAFETLPSGFLPSHAVSALCPSDVDPLHEQAVKQASRFEVLSSQDVEALARELRELDERCEYLRKTHRSLRAGRRNLHERVCTYLRSPRMAKFSYECLLKQEEALSELDVSIDGWVSKLEQADNRRIRVRQKLLEHVAATLLMKHPVSMRLDDLRSGTSGVNTPPRSPTSEPLLLDSAVDSSEPKELSLSDVSGLDVGTDDGKKARAQESLEDSEEDKALENILIYADSDVYALLADMEDEMKRFGSESEMVPETTVLSLEEEEEEEEIETEPVSPVFGIADCMSMLRSTTVPVESDLQQLAKSPPAC